jgi:hypothetical protein
MKAAKRRVTPRGFVFQEDVLANTRLYPDDEARRRGQDVATTTRIERAAADLDPMVRKVLRELALSYGISRASVVRLPYGVGWHIDDWRAELCAIHITLVETPEKKSRLSIVTNGQRVNLESDEVKLATVLARDTQLDVMTWLDETYAPEVYHPTRPRWQDAWWSNTWTLWVLVAAIAAIPGGRWKESHGIDSLYVFLVAVAMTAFVMALVAGYNIVSNNN